MGVIQAVPYSDTYVPYSSLMLLNLSPCLRYLLPVPCGDADSSKHPQYMVFPHNIPIYIFCKFGVNPKMSRICVQLQAQIPRTTGVPAGTEA